MIVAIWATRSEIWKLEKPKRSSSYRANTDAAKRITHFDLIPFTLLSSGAFDLAFNVLHCLSIVLSEMFNVMFNLNRRKLVEVILAYDSSVRVRSPDLSGIIT